MKKIGILTYHRATNYGAVLQAYSLCNKLKESFPNIIIEIIDYSTKAAKRDHIKDILRPLKHFKFIESFTIFKKNNIFKNFSNDCLELSKKKIVSDNIKELSKLFNEYDLIISGSDAVFSWNGKLFPTAYLLGEAFDCTKISYAASCHRLYYKSAPKKFIEYCKNSFSKYAYIGVRDLETENFVKFCNPDAITFHNCDPTFLLDLEEIEKNIDKDRLIKKLRIDSKKPTIIVMTPDPYIGEIISSRFSNKCNIVSLFVKNKYIDNFCYDLNPFEWACVFHYAFLTVTEYFHATILSLLNGVPTISIDKLCLSTGYEGKIYDLLIRRLQLNEFYINLDEINTKGYSIINSSINKVISNDYKNSILKALDRERENFKNFENVLKDLIAEKKDENCGQ